MFYGAIFDSFGDRDDEQRIEKSVGDETFTCELTWQRVQIDSSQACRLEHIARPGIGEDARIDSREGRKNVGRVRKWVDWAVFRSCFEHPGRSWRPADMVLD
jgi:hypothetical protein